MVEYKFILILETKTLVFKHILKVKMKLRAGLAVNLLAISLLLFACQNDKETDFLTEYQKTADEVVKIIEANPNTEGAANAREYLRSRKKLLKSKFDTNGILNIKNKKIDDQIAKFSELFRKYPVIQPELKELGLEFIEF